MSSNTLPIDSNKFAQHEKIAEVISRLIIAYCEKFEIQDFPFRQTRLEVKDYAGKEPDIAYAFNTDKELPDLVVEVIFSSGNLDERPQRGCLGGHSLAQNTELGKPRTRSWASVFRRRGLPPLPRYDREGCRGSLGLPNRGVGNARV